jgi:hypothetical protein
MVAPILEVLDSAPVLSKLGIKVVSKLNYIPAILGGVMMVMGTVTFLQFMQQQAIQAMSHSIDMLIQAGYTDDAKVQIEHLYSRYYLPFVDFSNNYGWMNPYTDDAWVAYADSVLLMIVGLKAKIGEA